MNSKSKIEILLCTTLCTLRTLGQNCMLDCTHMSDPDTHAHIHTHIQRRACRFTPDSLLPQTHIGIKGFVTDMRGNGLKHAIIHVANVTDDGERKEINHDILTGALFIRIDVLQLVNNSCVCGRIFCPLELQQVIA